MDFEIMIAEEGSVRQLHALLCVPDGPTVHKVYSRRQEY
ncbi:uncharacterized protein G2W53_023415 [Senna tora]|uniref:Uncharacterized protein n=1 Tax=Senna tora TaxID=362788 RepID=A0A834TB65_9FABA|nr:uncharacterized protein G2W53_023415 [Senna tora]